MTAPVIVITKKEGSGGLPAQILPFQTDEPGQEQSFQCFLQSVNESGGHHDRPGTEP